MTLSTFAVTFTMAIAFTTLALAAPSYDTDDESNYVNYDSIVEDLQKQGVKQPAAAGARTTARKGWFSSGASGDPFENVWIHAGVGFAQTTQNLALPNGRETYMAGRGVQAALGIDILGPNLAAEGTARTFGETEDSVSKVSLKEFDLKIIFKGRQSSLGYRAGAGLSARYMTVRSGTDTYDVTTPASVFTLGGDLFLTPSFSIGIDLSTRNAMISETFDRTSYDGAIRLDTHF